MSARAATAAHISTLSRRARAAPSRSPSNASHSAFQARTRGGQPGNVATLSWLQMPGLVSPPTFYAVSILAPSGIAVDNVLLPAVTSISAASSPGSYRLSLASGTACGTATGDAVLTFTVP